MAYLEVTKARQSNEFGRPESSRLVYRVILDDGKVLTLPDLAKKLRIPYTSLAARVHHHMQTGRHDAEFWTIVADVKKRAREGRLATRRCVHCKGTGRTPLEAGEVATDAAHS